MPVMTVAVLKLERQRLHHHRFGDFQRSATEGHAIIPKGVSAAMKLA